MKLWIIRHAKSSWAEPSQPDFERGLNKRGKSDGPKMAQWLATQTDPADWIWTSDAARARATTQFVARGFAAVAPKVVADHRLYHADVGAIIDILQQTPSEVMNVAVVAHNPGLTYLVNHLARRRVVDNLPTLGVARFTVAGDWATLTAHSTELELITGPKRLETRV